MPRSRIVTACLVAVAIPPLTLSAQSDTTAAISGKAISAYNGRPLVGVMIALPAARKFAVSDSNGVFQLGGLPTGKQKIRVAYAGRETEEFEFGLSGHRTKKVTVVLDADAADLAPVVVETRFPTGWRDLGGFYARKRFYSGWGRFYTREDLDRLHVSTLRWLLAREGVVTRCMNSWDCLPTLFSYGGACAVTVSVDGMPFWEHDYENIPIDQVAGVEIYRDGVVPIDFFTTRLYDQRGNQRRSCGNVQVWTR